jgi:hypothetical protein
MANGGKPMMEMDTVLFVVVCLLFLTFAYSFFSRNRDDKTAIEAVKERVGSLELSRTDMERQANDLENAQKAFASQTVTQLAAIATEKHDAGRTQVVFPKSIEITLIEKPQVTRTRPLIPTAPFKAPKTIVKRTTTPLLRRAGIRSRTTQ